MIARTDGGGEFHAARRTLIGPTQVARYFWKLARRRSDAANIRITLANGLPALVTHFHDERPGEPTGDP